MPISRGEAARTRITLISALLSNAMKSLIERKDLDLSIISHTVLLHQITRASVSLMKAACEESEKLIDQPVCRQLLPYLKHHIEDETNHDEWTLECFEAIGIDRDVVLASIPASNVAAMVGAQYYWIRHHHPVAILGYMMVIESAAPSGEFVKDLQMRTGLPEAFFNADKIHATLDPGHQAEMYQLLSDLPLEPEHEKLIDESLWHTGKMLADCLSNPQLWDRAGAAQAYRVK